MSLRSELVQMMSDGITANFESLKEKFRRAAQSGCAGIFVAHAKDQKLEDFLTANGLSFQFFPHQAFVAGGDPQWGNNFDDREEEPAGYEISWDG